MNKTEVMSNSELNPSKKGEGFSFVEVLAAIAIIGIITFWPFRTLVRIKQDGEDNLAIARAEALNLAIASYVQAKGTDASWNSTTAYRHLAALSGLRSRASHQLYACRIFCHFSGFDFQRTHQSWPHRTFGDSLRL